MMQKQTLQIHMEGTREGNFGLHIFPESLRINGNGQDFLKIDMMKYEPRELKKSNGSGLALKELGFEDRDMNRTSIGTVDASYSWWY